MTGGDFLQTPLRDVRGIGPRRDADLRRVGLATVEDLLCRFPLRYEDRSRFVPVASLEPGQTASILARIIECGVRLTRRRGFKLFHALVGDDTGRIRIAWLNQPFLRDVLHRDQRAVFYGTVEVGPSGALQLTNPQYEILEEDGDQVGVHTGRIVPVYERIGALSPKFQRALIQRLVAALPAEVPDPLPVSVRSAMGLPGRRGALCDVHVPPPGALLAGLNRFRAPAQVRLIVEEFFLLQVGLLLRRRETRAARKPCVPVVDDGVRAAVRTVLPFELTAGQKQAVREIVADLQAGPPMNRLLQGDVGAGKTIVAVIAAVVAMANGLQVAFMAPTEILAEQHFATLERLLSGAGYRLALLTGRTPAADRRAGLAALASGAVHLAVGTHALAQEAVAFQRLGLAVIDEQHRFGVLQRAHLRAKGLRPDVLVMTATPIPRTLALTVYGDLDVSVIRDLPPGRRPVRTTVRPESQRDRVHEFVRRQLDQGRQAYIVYPLVDESEKIDLRAATTMADHLAQTAFPAYRVALLHGQLDREAKERVMGAFAAGTIQVLVATSVVEVGIDVPNASVMVVEHAERFGLSQLHQLRGRVGRGAHESFCVLLYQTPLTEEGRARLRVLAETADGFLIAERDLELRGAGDVFGTRQSGVPTFRVGDLRRDRDLLDAAREQAARWLDGGEAGAADLQVVARLWQDRLGLIGVG